jgi:predicted Zn finger-like uncharacterized protein
MIIDCQNCNKKFEINDQMIPVNGRLVQCGFCNSQWHQLPQINTSQLEVIDKKVKLDKLNKVAKKRINVQKKEINLTKTISTKTKTKTKSIGFLSLIIIVLISTIAIFLVIETFKIQIINFWPQADIYINHVYETLENIFILIKDLFKSY